MVPGVFPIIKAVIFDMDGTLLDSEGMSAVATDYGFKKVLGRGITGEENAQLIGRPVKKILSQWFPDKGDEIYETGRKYYNDNISSIRIYPGVREMLEKISAMNLKMAVVTSSHRTDAETLLSIFGIMKYFQFYVGQEDTVYQKPDPDPLILALKKLQLRSTDCIYVGDQPYDIIAAHGAGIKPLGAVWGSGRAERMDQYHPEAILENPEDVVEFIRRMKWTGKGKS
jgi:pyrophosphatase PpaX